MLCVEYPFSVRAVRRMDGTVRRKREQRGTVDGVGACVLRILFGVRSSSRVASARVEVLEGVQK